MSINDNDSDIIFDIISRCINESYNPEMIQQLKKEGKTPRELIDKVKKDFITQINDDFGMWSLLQVQFFEVNYNK